ncbi:MAG: protein-disulfide reductase DsbD [Gammaproteobacteria bacterium]|nr:protein-disulfide reductase DsbD [Gammaproteobacteria bacterium]
MIPGAFAIDLLGTAGDDLLEPDRAFAINSVVVDKDTVRVSWTIADGYYLYRDRMKFSSATDGITLGTPDIPPGKIVDDEFFGKIAIFRNTVTTTIPVTRSANAPDSFELKAVSQGCADIGVCYPPHTQVASLTLPAMEPGGMSTAQAATAPTTLQSISDRLGLGGNDDEFLDPDDAFKVEAKEVSPGMVEVRWTIADDYYLYRDKLKITLADNPDVALGAISIPQGKTKHDEFFGDVQVFYNSTTAQVPVQHLTGKADEITLQVGHQGCAEAGICYPPAKKQLTVALSGESSSGIPATAAISTPAVTASQPISEQDRIADSLRSGNTWLTIAAFFVAGLLLAFTPCVFPMIPILSGIIIGQGKDITTRKALGLSLVYVLSMALTYTVVGVLVGLSGENIQAVFQNVWVISFFALVFVALSLSMFGFYELQMPNSIQSKLTEISNSQHSGNLIGVAIMGFLSALIVGPCVTAPLIGALIYIADTGDAVLGGMALFSLSMGMGAPLLLIGASAGKWLPRAGTWMDTVKAVFGVLLLGLAIWLLERVAPASLTMALWGVLLVVSSIYTGAIDRLPDDASGWRKLWKGFGLLLLAWGLAIIIGLAAGNRNVFQPLQGIGSLGTAGDSLQQSQKGLAFQQIEGIEGLNAVLATAKGKTVMLDFYADWCVSCKEMEHFTFSNPEVQATLADTVLLQADVTANDELDKALYKHFGIFGPPAIMLFDAEGKELRNYRVVGYVPADQFNAHVKRALNP